MLNRFAYFLPNNVEKLVTEESKRWFLERLTQRLWERDSTLWTGGNESEWLGWLEIAEREIFDLNKYHDFMEFSKQFDFVVLLGMGGSSLCPEVLAHTFRRNNFLVLDSTVPSQVISVEKKIDLSKTLFIVASKSGTTLEVECLRQYFWERVCELVGRKRASEHFVAITDPGSKLHILAQKENYVRSFLGEPQIGGRFSALSVFGLAPAAAMQIDIRKFLEKSLPMVQTCKFLEPEENFGVILGLILGVCWRLGKDKLTFFCSKEIESFGAWLEQLIAESTGKNGKAIIPIDKEKPMRSLSDYDDDRVFVHIKLRDSVAIDHEGFSAFGHPFIRIEIEDEMALGQEFFRWEFATAVAGSIMQVNPFDQPDVESVKLKTKSLIEEYELSGVLSETTSFFESEGIKLFASDSYRRDLERFAGDERNLSRFLEAHIEHIQKGDYFAILAYLESSYELEQVLQEIRHKVLRRELCATCLQFGPRFLHSTGQAYKGGPNTGVFLQITADDDQDLPVPGQKYGFTTVKLAQALGDFQVLVDRKRRVLRVHVKGDILDGLRKIRDSIGEI